MSTAAPKSADVVIVGAGLAGLACAVDLYRRGLEVVVLEASDGVGGRVRTDVVDGFQLDRGFQVLLSAYPEAQRVLNYRDLDLHPFYPGLLIRLNGRFVRMTDPLRRPLDGLRSVRAPIGTLADKIRLAGQRGRLRGRTPEQLMALYEPGRTTYEALRYVGFSDEFIDHFYRPFLGGALLDRELETPVALGACVLAMFTAGSTVLPARGMRAIPEQLASRLVPSALRTRSRVRVIDDTTVTLDTGEQVRGRAVVVACDANEAARLTGGVVSPPQWRSVTCLYFTAPKPPVDDPILVVDGDGRGPVNNLSVQNLVAPTYAPPGQYLISASVLGVPQVDDATLEGEVRAQMGEWFGNQVQAWRLLRTYRIEHALPMVQASRPKPQPEGLPKGWFIAGDHRANPSINGALSSGRDVAERCARYLASAS
jgi:phytoene dehydrogenase-like protein